MTGTVPLRVISGYLVSLIRFVRLHSSPVLIDATPLQTPILLHRLVMSCLIQHNQPTVTQFRAKISAQVLNDAMPGFSPLPSSFSRSATSTISRRAITSLSGIPRDINQHGSVSSTSKRPLFNSPPPVPQSPLQNQQINDTGINTQINKTFAVSMMTTAPLKRTSFPLPIPLGLAVLLSSSQKGGGISSSGASTKD